MCGKDSMIGLSTVLVVFSFCASLGIMDLKFPSIYTYIVDGDICTNVIFDTPQICSVKGDLMN